MYLDRLLLLHQRLRRDKAFSRPALADADISEHSTYCQVVKAFLGHSSETVFKLSEVALVLLVLTSCRYLSVILILQSQASKYCLHTWLVGFNGLETQKVCFHQENP